MIQNFGFGFLRLSGEQFWSMTPKEIFHALSFYSGGQQQPLDRDEFMSLAQKYPDAQI